MLEEMVKNYVEALKKRDKKTMRQIEGTLFKVGMDKYTLIFLARELLMEEAEKESK